MPLGVGYDQRAIEDELQRRAIDRAARELNPDLGDQFFATPSGQERAAAIASQAGGAPSFEPTRGRLSPIEQSLRSGAEFLGGTTARGAMGAGNLLGNVGRLFTPEPGPLQPGAGARDLRPNIGGSLLDPTVFARDLEAGRRQGAVQEREFLRSLADLGGVDPIGDDELDDLGQMEQRRRSAADARQHRGDEPAGGRLRESFRRVSSDTPDLLNGVSPARRPDLDALPSGYYRFGLSDLEPSPLTLTSGGREVEGVFPEPSLDELDARAAREAAIFDADIASDSIRRIEMRTGMSPREIAQFADSFGYMGLDNLGQEHLDPEFQLDLDKFNLDVNEFQQGREEFSRGLAQRDRGEIGQNFRTILDGLLTNAENRGEELTPDRMQEMIQFARDESESLAPLSDEELGALSRLGGGL